MDNRKVIYKMAIASAMAISIVGCKSKKDETDNNQVISKPYVLYAGDSSGRIVKTNDGYNYETVFGFDYYPAIAITPSGKNLLFVKRNVHVIENFGANLNSNPTILYPSGPAGIGESIIHHWTKHNRVYVSGVGPKGMMYNDSNGKPNRWVPVGDETISDGTLITSFTELMNGTLVAYDDAGKKIFTLDNTTSKWQQTAAGSLPSAGKFFISHIENTILAADISVDGKVYYSTDMGKTFQSYSGLPAGVKIRCVNAPGDRAILVGTDGLGIFKLPLGSKDFVSANLGMPTQAIVKSITGKYDYYKNNSSKNYTYAATNQGIYRSEDFGDNWTKVFEGNYTSLF